MIQKVILQELCCVNDRLDLVEKEVGTRKHRSSHKRSQLSKSKNIRDKSSKVQKHVPIDSCSSLSSDSDDLPTLSLLRASNDVQRKVDGRVAQLEQNSRIEGDD